MSRICDADGAFVLAMQQIISRREVHNTVLVSRWKLFDLFLRLCLFRPRRGRFVPDEGTW